MKVHSIFESISGEAGFIPQGTWCTFIRLQGCNLSCSYCDTPQANHIEGGYDMEVSEIIRKVVLDLPNRHILITGGEPLRQGMTPLLINELLAQKFNVQVETNGSIEWVHIARGCKWVVDYKCPSSGEELRMLPTEIFVSNLVRTKSIVKFVIKDDFDLGYALTMARTFIRKGYHGKFIFSPVNATADTMNKIIEAILHPKEDFITRLKDDKILDRIIFSLQLHKIVNLP